MESPRSPRRTVSGVAVCAALAAGVLAAAALPATAPAQEAREASGEWSCFRSWTVSFMQESDPFTVERAPWALRWRRTTPTHTDHDGLFAELYPVEEGEKSTGDQVAAVNTDHEGHEGTVTVEETGTFWLDVESWSRQTEWEIEACHPAKPPSTKGGR